MPRIALVTDIAAPPEVCFDVARDVGVHLAASRSQRVVGGVRSGMMRLGDEVTWRARHFGVAWTMTSKIVEYERPGRFVDQMQRGPFGHWHHEHLFDAADGRTRMRDVVDYASPLGPLGWIADAVVVRRYMTTLLRRHNQHLRETAEKRVAGSPERPERRGVEGTKPHGRSDSRYEEALARQTIRVCGIGRTTIRCAPQAALEFVLDVEQYRKADHKIGRIHWVHRNGNHGEVRHGGRFLRLPAPSATLSFELTPDSRLDLRGVAMPWPLRGFDGSFTCQVIPEGTSVIHTECFLFGPFVGHLFRAALGRWLARDIQAEVERMKRLIETSQPTAQSPAARR